MTVYQSETQRVTQVNQALESKHLRYVLRMTSLRSGGGDGWGWGGGGVRETEEERAGSRSPKVTASG